MRAPLFPSSFLSLIERLGRGKSATLEGDEMTLLINAGRSLGLIPIVFSLFSIVMAQTPSPTPERQPVTENATSASTQAFVEKSSAEIRKRFTDLETQERVNVDAKRPALHKAELQVNEAQKATAITEASLVARKREVDAAQFRIKQLQESSPTAEQMATATAGYRDEVSQNCQWDEKKKPRRREVSAA